MTRSIKYSEAIHEAIDQSMAADPSVYVIGLGVPDPMGIFGTTGGLTEKYGETRVMDMPISENAVTGILLGSAITGMRPIMTHQRVDFALLSLDQIVNQAAKWHYMFGGQKSVPLVIRMLVGRGWGQGPQHSQSLQSWFAHVPGLKVIMPSNAYDAKGLMVAAIADNNPVVSIEHRWLYNTIGEVPKKMYDVPLGQCAVSREGKDVTIVATSLMALEALRAADILAEENISAEVVDLRTVNPIDWATIIASVKKTRRLVVADTASKSFGISAEIVARCTEELEKGFKNPPQRVALPDTPSPSSSKAIIEYYPREVHVADTVLQMFGKKLSDERMKAPSDFPLDIPSPDYIGPF